MESQLARMSVSRLGALSSWSSYGSRMLTALAMVAIPLGVVISTAPARSAVAPAVLSPALVGR
jgi:hypothetical protein